MGKRFFYLFLGTGILLLGCAGQKPDSTDTGGKSTDEEINISRLSKTLSDDILYANDLAIGEGAVGMQSFDILANGDILACGIANGALWFQRMGKSGVCELPMKIWFAGHGTNMSVEEDGGEVYLWTSNYASHIDEGSDYYVEKLISRVKYSPGAELLPEDCDDNYYVGPYKNMLVSTDSENDLLCVICEDDGKSGYDTKARIWTMSEAKKAPVRDVSLGEVNRGGDPGCPVKVRETIYPVVSARDLTKLRPLFEFSINGKALDGDDPMQGFCVYGNDFYWFAGDGGKRSAMVSVVGFDGEVKNLKVGLAVGNRKEDVVSLGSESGYFEPEGIKIRNGEVFAGFLWGHKNNHRLTIINL